MLIDCEIHWFRWGIANGENLTSDVIPSVNLLSVRIDKIKIATRSRSAARDVEKITSEFLYAGPSREDRRLSVRFRCRWISRKVQPREFPLPKFEPTGFVANGRIVTHFTIAVAMKVSEAHVARVVYPYCAREWLIGADYSVAVKIGDSDVVASINL